MISYIKGTIEQISDGAVIIEANGIGYGVSASSATISQLTLSKPTKLYTYMAVRDDGISLAGFISMEEYDLFIKLLSVSGLGMKSALSMLSSLSVQQITLAVITNDINTLARAQGVGKKTAARIVLDLKDKLDSSGVFEGTAGGASLSYDAASSGGGAKQDAIDALIALGFARSEAVKAVMEIPSDGLDAEQIIKQALKNLKSK